MANYEGPILQATVATTYKTAAALYAVGARRFQIYEIEFGQAGSYATTDINCQWDLSIFSATNLLTGSTVVLNKLDQADGTAVTLFVNNATSELTYTTAGNGLSLKNWSINQRGSYRWRALDDGDNIVMPNTALTGAGLRVISPGFAATASVVATSRFVTSSSDRTIRHRRTDGTTGRQRE